MTEILDKDEYEQLKKNEDMSPLLYLYWKMNGGISMGIVEFKNIFFIWFQQLNVNTLVPYSLRNLLENIVIEIDNFYNNQNK